MRPPQLQQCLLTLAEPLPPLIGQTAGAFTYLRVTVADRASKMTPVRPTPDTSVWFDKLGLICLTNQQLCNHKSFTHTFAFGRAVGCAFLSVRTRLPHPDARKPLQKKATPKTIPRTKKKHANPYNIFAYMHLARGGYIFHHPMDKR